jgi:mono/diheme cytochrome c family protein
VGEESWESIFLTRRGANHGWAFLEGTRPGLRAAETPADFLSNSAHHYVPPVYSYDHNVGRSALGGLVYRGKTLTQLYGLYVFADHSWGHVIALATSAHAPATVLPVTWKPYLTAIGTDPRDGEILATDLTAGRVWKLVYNTNFVGQPLPETLADTGVFDDLQSLTPAPGFVPYSLNQSFWSDDAVKRRWFCLPETNQTFAVSIQDAWIAPPGAVWVKHFDIDTVVGDPGTRRRLETRLLVRNTRGVYGVTYRWEGPNSATLVPEQGADEFLVRERPAKPFRQSFTQKWRYPSRAECLVCHTPQAGYSLGFKTAQLNCEVDLGGIRTNQLSALAAAGYLDSPLPRPRDLPALAHPADTRYSLEWRVRSYLEANCASCHRPGGTALGHWDARTVTPTALAGLINGPLINARGDANNRVIAPGDSPHSVLLQRMGSRGAGQMPPLGSSIPDPVGVELLQEWIRAIQDWPQPDPPAVLSVVSHGGRARIHIRQPANRRLQIEISPFLEVPSWQPLELPETVLDYPAEPRSVVVEYPLGDDSIFFRVQSLAP